MAGSHFKVPFGCLLGKPLLCGGEPEDCLGASLNMAIRTFNLVPVWLQAPQRYAVTMSLGSWTMHQLWFWLSPWQDYTAFSGAALLWWVLEVRLSISLVCLWRVLDLLICQTLGKKMEPWGAKSGMGFERNCADVAKKIWHNGTHHCNGCFCQTLSHIRM